MRALVTGATGFTGSHLVRHLVARGYEVRVLVRPGSCRDAVAGCPVEWVLGDLSEEEPLDRAVRGVDVVFHVAALYRAENVPRRAFWQVNVEGTRRLLEAAARCEVQRVVHCSTVGVQGDIRHPPATEEAPVRPSDHYQASKAAGERLALSWFRERRVPGVVVRPTGIYGPGDRRFLKLFRMIDTGRFRMIGSGEVLYHLTYVDDVVRGMIVAAEHPLALGEVFTLGGPEWVTLNQLVALVAEVLGRPAPDGIRVPVGLAWTLAVVVETVCRPLRIPPPIYRRRLDFFTKNRAFDVSKARTVLGFEPRVSLREGLERTAAWYRDHGWLR